jgi:superfamily II DNA or RNA helicase
MKCITNYTLGLSGTMQRKDGLTKVFKMFLGNIIHKEKSNTSEHKVIVKAINYKVNDAEFNEMKYDYRGNPLYSTMISKLCNYNHRSEFILTVLKHELEENNDQQIMILAHNKTLITYLYKAVEHRNIGTVGYYIGGMKQVDLQETEYKQVVLATYAMAAEALDIKSLSILVMASPKTDITQSVGRILRVRHDNPIVVDIVDRHDIFQNQWKQRRRFYKKCNYRILSTDSVRYKGMNIDWASDKTWNHVFDPKVQKMGCEPIEKKKCLINIADLDMDTEV